MQEGPYNIIVSSYTKAAAYELVHRVVGIPESAIGTLHAHCFRALGLSGVAETEDSLEAWNEEYPGLPIGKTAKSVEDAQSEITGQGEGSRLLMEYGRMRNLLRPRELWPSDVESFAVKWEDFKKQIGLPDFTDMIELGLTCLDGAPNGATVGFFDEAQDFSAMQLALVRKWGEKLKFHILAGDDDQTLYSFVGATPDAFLTPEIPEEQKRFLTQSYRVPSLPQAVAEAWIRKVSIRQDKPYHPRVDENGFVVEGEVTTLHHGTMNDTQAVVDYAAAEVEAGRSVMILASCSYQLQRMISNLRRDGLPFHNPYRRSNGAWNPLARRKGSTSTADRLLAFMLPEAGSEDFPLWSPRQLSMWVELIKTKGVLQRKGKERIRDMVASGMHLDQGRLSEFLMDMFEPEALDMAISFDAHWLKEHALKSKASALEFPMDVIRKRGHEALVNVPMIIPGTIHSVKGGQADTVIVVPDISQQAYEHSLTTAGSDDLVRQFYVAMTRCRQKLVFLKPATNSYARGMYDY